MASSASLESSEAATIDGLIFSKLQATISLPLSLLSTQSQNKVMILVVASLLNTFGRHNFWSVRRNMLLQLLITQLIVLITQLIYTHTATHSNFLPVECYHTVKHRLCESGHQDCRTIELLL